MRPCVFQAMGKGVTSLKTRKNSTGMSARLSNFGSCEGRKQYRRSASGRCWTTTRCSATSVSANTSANVCMIQQVRRRRKSLWQLKEDGLSWGGGSREQRGNNGNMVNLKTMWLSNTKDVLRAGWYFRVIVMVTLAGGSRLDLHLNSPWSWEHRSGRPHQEKKEDTFPSK